MDADHPSQMMIQQHRDIDTGIQAVAEGGGDLAALAASLKLLRKHLFLEEEVMFPAVERGGITMPIFVMKREHGMMWPLLESLSAACAAGADPAMLREDCAELYKLLQIHNPKEEQIVYSAADNLTVRSGDGGAMAAELDVAELPKGWVCEMAPAG